MVHGFCMGLPAGLIASLTRPGTPAAQRCHRRQPVDHCHYRVRNRRNNIVERSRVCWLAA
jgi:hypothetical protein